VINDTVAANTTELNNHTTDNNAAVDDDDDMNDSNDTTLTDNSTIQGECPICLQTFTSADNIYSTDCNHIFCSDCITASLTASEIGVSQTGCPICRKVIKHVKLIQQASSSSREPHSTSSSTGTSRQQSKRQKNHTYQSLSFVDTDTHNSLSSSNSNSISSGTRTGTASDILIVHVKYNRQIYDVPVSTSITYKQFKEQLSKLFHVDRQFMKIVHKGSILVTDDQLSHILYSGMMNAEKGVYVVFQLIAAISDRSADSKWSDSSRSESSSSNCVIA
jgi:hypothetical protein